MAEVKFECAVCNIKCSGIEPYMQHMSSAKHKKKVEQGKLNASLGTSGNDFFCEVCNVPCSGVAPYQQHITSDKHLKKVQTAKFLSGKSVSSDEADHPMKRSYPELAEGVAKREKASSLAPNASGTSGTDLLPRIKHNVYKCYVCDKICTGPVPYQIHIESPIHLKNVRKAAILSEMKAGKDSSLEMTGHSEVLDNDVSSTSNNKAAELSKSEQSSNKISSAHAAGLQDYYFCSTCDKQFTGPVPFRQHMVSALHEKHVRRAAMLGDKMEVDLTPGKNAASPEKVHGITNMAMDHPLAECYVCNVKLYSLTELHEHYDSIVHHDNQNIYDYKRKVKVFGPDEPFDLKG